MSNSKIILIIIPDLINLHITIMCHSCTVTYGGTSLGLPSRVCHVFKLLQRIEI